MNSPKQPKPKTTEQRFNEFAELLARARAKRIEAQALIRAEFLKQQPPAKRAA